MPKVQTLKPRIGLLDTRRVPSLFVPREGATERTRGGKWSRMRAKWLREHPLCCMCQAEGYVTAADEVDHVVPLWEGGKDDPSNFQSLCRPHHKAKSAEEAARRGGGSRSLGPFGG
jgi:5-methylcytosine-specific restriction endonuclease McrA